MAPPRDLIPDSVAEILLRLPPSDPATLVRASAVCKPWLRTLTDPAFLRRYRAFHGTPLVLGFLRNPDDRDLPRFVPDAAFRQSPAAAAAAAVAAGHRTCHVLDCRHGRALLYDYRSCEFVCWDPITGRESRIRDRIPDVYTNHAVLCAGGAGCDHSGCGGGPFLMASVGVFRLDFNQVDSDLFSLETGARVPIGPDSLYLDYDRYSLEDRQAALVGGVLYFVGSSNTLLRYDVLSSPKTLSLIKLPKKKRLGTVVAMKAEDGGLGLASLLDYSLHLWLRETGEDGDASWVQRWVIDLKKLLPVGSLESPVYFSGFAEGANVVFVRTDDGVVFSIDKSLQVRKVCEMDGPDHIIPYVSFFTPAACARGILPSSVGTQ